MKIKWKKNNNLKASVILKHVSKIRNNKDGKTSYSGFEIHDAESALFSMLDFGDNFPIHMKERLISEALFKVGGELTEDKVVDWLNSKYKEISSTHEKEYYLLTSISAKIDFDFPKFKINGCEIQVVTGSFPKKFNSRNNIYKHHDWALKLNPAGYKKVLVKTKSRNEFEAAEKCLDAINLLRFFLCFGCNSSITITIPGSDKVKPINRVLLGGCHTLHNTNGKLLADDVFWFEPNFNEVRPHLIKNNPILIKNLKYLARNYEQSKFRGDLKKSMLLFLQGLDSVDYHNGLISVWGALELLAAKGSEGKNDLISRRCSFLWSDSEYHKAIIEHVREYRNKRVHYGEAGSSASTHCFQIQRYYQTLFKYYINKAFKHKSLESANEFLDLPTNADEIKAKRVLLNRALKFRPS